MRKLKILDELKLAHTLVSEGLVGKSVKANKTTSRLLPVLWTLVTIKEV